MPYCVWPICKTCDNNGGGYCDDSHEAEAERMGVKVTDIVTNDRCLLYDRAPTD